MTIVNLYYFRTKYTCGGLWGGTRFLVVASCQRLTQNGELSGLYSTTRRGDAPTHTGLVKGPSR